MEQTYDSTLAAYEIWDIDFSFKPCKTAVSAITRIFIRVF